MWYLKTKLPFNLAHTSRWAHNSCVPLPVCAIRPSIGPKFWISNHIIYSYEMADVTQTVARPHKHNFASVDRLLCELLARRIFCVLVLFHHQASATLITITTFVFRFISKLVLRRSNSSVHPQNLAQDLLKRSEQNLQDENPNPYLSSF